MNVESVSILLRIVVNVLHFINIIEVVLANSVYVIQSNAKSYKKDEIILTLIIAVCHISLSKKKMSV